MCVKFWCDIFCIYCYLKRLWINIYCDKKIHLIKPVQCYVKVFFGGGRIFWGGNKRNKVAHNDNIKDTAWKYLLNICQCNSKENYTLLRPLKSVYICLGLHCIALILKPCFLFSELGSLTTANLMEKVRGLQNLAYQLGLDECKYYIAARAVTWMVNFMVG